MNYLAHAFLSFGDDEILVGNMISDFVKGRKKYDYPDRIRDGIGIHRQIDGFTDSHDATREAKKAFQPVVGLYAGAFVDVVYDHFLALDAERFPGGALADFVGHTYATLYRYAGYLPPRFAALLPYMQSQNWLLNYRLPGGIGRSFEGIVKRAKYLSDSKPAYRAFIQHYDMLASCYKRFMPDVQAFAGEQLRY